MTKRILLIGVLFLFLSNKNPDAGIKPLVFFESVYNGAGESLQLHGETIDGKGRIHYFNARNKNYDLKFKEWNYGRWNCEGQCSEMTPVEVQKNLSLCDSVGRCIHPDTLSKYVHLLSLIAKSGSPLSDTKISYQTMYGDTIYNGITSIYGFVYDAKRNIYKRILIAKYGDVTQQNTSAYANQFKQWEWAR